MRTLFLDTETFCAVPITHGTHAYAEAAEVIILAYAWDEGDVQVVAHPSMAHIQELVDEADEIVIHNSAFDRTVLAHQQVRIPLEKIHDTMVRALLHSLPGSLDALCSIMGVPVDKAKDKAGKRLIQLFCKPLGRNRKLDRADMHTHPKEWTEFMAYAGSDILAMREIYRRLPKWNWTAYEQALWRLDQQINDTGIAVDTELAAAALRTAQTVKTRLAEEARELTDGAVPSTTQGAVTLAYLRDILGVEIGDLRGGTVAEALKGDISDEARELLNMRATAAASSPAKYSALLKGVSSDGRLRGTLQFCGASRSGRWGGRIFQPQNLPRPTMKQKDIDAGIEAMKLGVEDLLFDDPMELCISAVRGALVAAPGKKFVIADLSNIEGRVLAWLAEENWKVEAFRQFDKGIGHDIYKITAGGILGKKPEDITKDERQVSGKVPELACGYQGSVGAFAVMGAAYGVHLPEDRALEIVKAWRAKHKATVDLWYSSERAAVSAVRRPGEVFRVKGLAFQCKGPWLRIRLPSGRYLTYFAPQVDDDGKLSYEGTNQYTRKWERLNTYGGKLVENAVQAIARDVLAAGLWYAAESGYNPVLHVHDEIICETPDSPDYTVEDLSAMMSRGTQWSVGLPLAAAGFECYRYRKE